MNFICFLIYPLLYHNNNKEDSRENIIRSFYTLSPNVNLINPYGLHNNEKYNCFYYKLKKDLSVLDLNKDVFYHNLFDEKHQDNFNIIKDYNNFNTWEKNKGKRMLALIICKTTLFILSNSFYYRNVLAHFDIDAFIYNHGYYKSKLLGTELGFNKDADKYVSYIKMKEGVCSS